MRLLYRLFINRFILSLLVLALFALDYFFIQVIPMRIISFTEPNVTASEYYEVELGEAKIYVLIHYDGDKIHLVPTTITPDNSLTQKNVIIPYYYYALALVIVNIIPWKIFFPSKKKKKKDKEI